MIIISKAVLREFTSKYNEAKDSVAKWYNETKLADWNSFADVKRHLIRLMR